MNQVKKIRIGIIGQGRSGRDIHAAAAMNLPEMYEIVAISDPVEERRTRAKKELNCEVYADYQDLIKHRDIDLIINATPSQMHVPVSLEILEAGKHVLCEKPLARRVTDVDALIQAAEKSGKMLMVYQQLRYAPAFKQLCEVIDSGILGRIVQVSLTYSGFSRRWDWQTLQEKDGGNLLNTGSHAIDQALRLYGNEGMPQVACLMDKAVTFGDADDFVKIVLHGPDRPFIDVEISSCNTYPGLTFQAQGTLGGIIGSHQRLDWKYYRPEEAQDQQLISEALSGADGTPVYCSEALIWHEKSWEPANEFEANPYNSGAMKYYADMHRALINSEPHEVTIQDIRRQVSIIEQCFQQNPRFSKKHRA